jgi:hypothetical protein
MHVTLTKSFVSAKAHSVNILNTYVQRLDGARYGNPRLASTSPDETLTIGCSEFLSPAAVGKLRTEESVLHACHIDQVVRERQSTLMVHVMGIQGLPQQAQMRHLPSDVVFYKQNSLFVLRRLASCVLKRVCYMHVTLTKSFVSAKAHSAALHKT